MALQLFEVTRRFPLATAVVCTRCAFLRELCASAFLGLGVAYGRGGGGGEHPAEPGAAPLPLVLDVLLGWESAPSLHSLPPL